MVTLEKYHRNMCGGIRGELFCGTALEAVFKNLLHFFRGISERIRGGVPGIMFERTRGRNSGNYLKEPLVNLLMNFWNNLFP